MSNATSLRGSRPEPPVFDSIDEERSHRKERIAIACRVFGDNGFDEGNAGHITARDPEYPDRFWVNPLGQPFSHVRVSDLCLVDHDGRLLEGEGPVNGAAFAIHSAVHRARPDVVAAAHAHSLHAKSWSSLGRLLDPITQDAALLFENHSIYSDYRGIVADVDEGELIAEALGPTNRMVILANHGFLTVGGSVDEAAFYFVSAERSAHAQLMAEAVGTPNLIDSAVARKLGTSRGGWRNFQPYVKKCLRVHTDVFD